MQLAESTRIYNKLFHSNCDIQNDMVLSGMPSSHSSFSVIGSGEFDLIVDAPLLFGNRNVKTLNFLRHHWAFSPLRL